MTSKSCERVVENHVNSGLNDIAVGLLQTEVVKLETELWFQEQKCGTLEDEIEELNKRLTDDEGLLAYERSDLADQIDRKKKELETAEWEAYRNHLVIDRYRKHLSSRTTLPVE